MLAPKQGLCNVILGPRIYHLKGTVTANDTGWHRRQQDSAILKSMLSKFQSQRVAILVVIGSVSSM